MPPCTLHGSMYKKKVSYMCLTQSYPALNTPATTAPLLPTAATQGHLTLNPPCNLQTARTTVTSSSMPEAGLQQPRATADSEDHSPESADVCESLLLEGPHEQYRWDDPERRSHRGGERGKQARGGGGKAGENNCRMNSLCTCW